MRALPSLIAPTLLISTTSAAPALTVFSTWQGVGKSDVFAIPAKLDAWRAAWSCELRSSPTIALIDADDGRVVNFLGASFRGEKMLSGTGRFQWDTRGTFCEVTVTSLN